MGNLMHPVVHIPCRGHKPVWDWRDKSGNGNHQRVRGFRYCKSLQKVWKQKSKKVKDT